jgi:hypothetical protein
MYLTSKNGHFGEIVYSVKDIIDYNNSGYIVYQPIFTNYGASFIPRQSQLIPLLNNGKLLPMEFRNGIPYFNNKILPEI